MDIEPTNPGSLRDMILAQVRLNPDATALLAADQDPLSYGNLLEQMDAVGRLLRAQGVTRSDAVAVVLPNGPQMATAFLGVAAYARCAPLNPNYREEECEFFLTDLEAKAVILRSDSQYPVKQVAEQLGLKVLSISPNVDRAGTLEFFPPAPDTDGVVDDGDGDDVALILHTSGTTSRPKQVPITHRSLCASSRNIATTLQLSANDRCLNVMPLFHIHGLIGALCSSLCSGGSVVCSAGFDGATFSEIVDHEAPTWYSAVPTIHQSVLALASEDPTLASRAGFRMIRSSSSSLPPTVMEELEDKFGVPVIESYGMTEACHQMASNPLPPAQRKAGSVGLPAGPEMAIMDDKGDLLPQGATGEIVIRGENVTTGYLRNPEANETAFSNGWFRTGDRGHCDADGYYYVTGRTKEMINRGGENISPREVDEALLEHPAVQQAVAFAVPHPTLGEDVAAAVVLNEAHPFNANQLRRFVFDRLAAFKVPSRIVNVATIPKGPTGKLRRIGLAEQLEVELRSTYVEPRTELERGAAAAMQEVLGIAELGATDNFFAMGGDSLKAARVNARLSSEFQVDLSPVIVFLNPTPEELSLEITRVLSQDDSMLEELLDEVEGMSDDEVRQQLQ